MFHVLWQLILVQLEYLDMDPCFHCSKFFYNLSCFISCLCTPDQNWLHFSLLSALTISIMQPPHLQLLAWQTERKSKYWIFPLFQGHHVPRNVGDELCGVLEVTYFVVYLHSSIQRAQMCYTKRKGTSTPDLTIRFRYSNITCCGYPLGALDSIMSDGSTNWGSAIMLILQGYNWIFYKNNHYLMFNI